MNRKMRNFTPLIIIILLSIFSMSTSARIDKPDFAFPKTVSADARQAMAKIDVTKPLSVADQDLYLSLQEQYITAQVLIDSDKAPELIEKLTAVIPTVSDATLRSLLRTLLVKMYGKYYSDDRWRFDRRELPLSPLPDNISEWSGEMFRLRIAGLAKEAMDEAISDSTPVAGFVRSIEIPDTTSGICYPAVSDFVAAQVVEICRDSNLEDEAKDITARYAAATAPGTAPYLVWRLRKITGESNSSGRREKFVELYRTSGDNPYRALVLLAMTTSDGYPEDFDIYDYIKEIEEGDRETSVTPGLQDTPETRFKTYLAQEIEKTLSEGGNTFLSKELRSALAKLCAPSAKLQYPSLVSGDKVDVTVDVSSASTLKINVYRIPDNVVGNYRLLRERKYGSPLQTLTLNYRHQAPFNVIDTVTVQLPEYGYYLILPEVKGAKAGDYYYGEMVRRVPVMPVALSGVDTPGVVIASSCDGEPMPDVTVTGYFDAKVQGKAVTDRKGLASFLPGIRVSDIVARAHGRDYRFDNLRLRYYTGSGQETPTNRAQVLTDRAIYHPGDKLNFIAVCYSTDSHVFEAGRNVRVTLLNANRQRVDSINATTDDFGRVCGTFTIPKEGLTGTFAIIVNMGGKAVGNAYVTVSDYKMPEYEFADLNVSRDAPEQGCVTVSGRLVTYSGMPVADAEIDVILTPVKFRWFWQKQSAVASFTVNCDSDGRFSAVFTQDMLKGKDSDFFSASFSALSQAGERITEQTTFSVGKPYVVSIGLDVTDIDGEKPFTIPCSVLNPQGEKQNVALSWSLSDKNKTTVAEGALNGSIDLRSVRPGRYTLTVEPVDTLLADPAKKTIIIYNVKSGIVPVDAGLWCPVSKIESHEAARRVLVATADDTTWVYTCVNVGDKVDPVKCQLLKRGYHYIDAELPEGCHSASVKIFTVRDCKVTEININVDVPWKRDLKIVAESMRERLTPSTSETWRLRITDSDGKPVSAAVVLDLYNKALEALAQHSLSLGFGKIQPNNRLSINFPRRGSVEIYSSVDIPFEWAIIPDNPEYRYLDLQTRLLYDYAMPMARSRMMYSKSMSPALNASAEVEEEASYDDTAVATGAADAGEATEPFSYREAEVPMALWAPMLTTDADGNLSITFTVPNANTTWRLLSVAWDKTGATGSMIRDFIANKPLMVQPLMPRFLRQGDTADINATVYNNSDSTLTSKVTFELFNPLSQELISAEERVVTLEAGAQTVVHFTLSTLTGNLGSMSAVGVRVKAIGDTFADGELTVLPLLSSMAQLIETEPFYLNPSDTAFTTTLPDGEDARLSMTYCANPVWTVVSALPGLREQYDYANSAAAALFSASTARGLLKDNPEMAKVLRMWHETPGDSALLSQLQKNEDLKIALLSATPWVVNAMNDTERMNRLSLIFDDDVTRTVIDKAVATLLKYQRSGGGFSWSDWSDRQSYWVTLNVLGMMGDLHHFGWLPMAPGLRQILKDALRYVDNYPDRETDIVYTAIRPLLADYVSITANGQEVITSTINDIIAHWKEYTPDYKAIAALALYRNNYRTKSRELLSSLEQFAVSTPSQGVKFPNINSLAAYGCVLEAFAEIAPQSPMVDGLRQQLIVRKQATDWGSSVVTSQVVRGILSCGTKWTNAPVHTRIDVGGELLEPENTPSAAIGDIRLNLSPYAGQKLTLTRGDDALNGPAYGAVYAQFKQQMQDVKAASCDDLSIEKRLYRRAGTGWETVDSLTVGDRVKVSLLITTKRNLSYVSVVDERPASFAPADQLPGWVYSDGAGFYRENRDAVTNLSIDYLRPGTYILEYEMNVQHSGRYSSGVASAQSQYAPEISAHSSGTVLDISAK